MIPWALFESTFVASAAAAAASGEVACSTCERAAQSPHASSTMPRNTRLSLSSWLSSRSLKTDQPHGSRASICHAFRVSSLVGNLNSFTHFLRHNDSLQFTNLLFVVEFLCDLRALLQGYTCIGQLGWLHLQFSDGIIR